MGKELVKEVYTMYNQQREILELQTLEEDYVDSFGVSSTPVLIAASSKPCGKFATGVATSVAGTLIRSFHSVNCP